MTGSLFDIAAPKPLADRLRPSRLEDVVGQEHLLALDSPLGRMIARSRLSSLILWGPPGVGKTTIARLLADRVGLTLERLSAVLDGLPELRKALEAAKGRRSGSGRCTLLFVDEIHRWNKAQQDALLPHIEDGSIVLVGATTENPSFSVLNPLLSRAAVLRLKPLGERELEALLCRAEAEIGWRLPLSADARALLTAMADGDGRYLLNMAEQLSDLDPSLEIAPGDLPHFVQRRGTGHDKSGDAHHALLSAFQKSIRGSSAAASCYYLARLLKAGEPPRAVFRRLLVMATEEIGLADPAAIQHTVACSDAFERMGEPEGLPALAQATLYLATAVKSNAAYQAFYRAMELAESTGNLPVPDHLINAPTRMMKEMGFKQGYRYDHDYPHAFAGQEFFPQSLAGPARPEIYRPVERGNEREVRRRMQFWEKLEADQAFREAGGGDPG